MQRISCVGTLSVLIVHSPDDEIIPIQHGRALFAAANEPKKFLEIRGSHNEGFLASERTYIDGLDVFLTRYLPYKMSRSQTE